MSDRRRRQPNLRLRALIHEAGWTQEALARAVRAVGAEAGVRLYYDRTTVGHWLAGALPRPGTRLFVLEALVRRLERPLSAEEAGFPAPHRRDPDVERAVRRPAVALQRLTQDSLAMLSGRGEERPFRVRSVVGVSWPHAVADPETAEGSEGLTPLAQPAELRAVERFFASSVDTFGGVHARRALLAYVGHDVSRLYPAGRFGDRHRAALSGAGRLAYLAARMSGDAGRNGAAQLCLENAMSLAAAGGDPVTWALALRGMSERAGSLGHVGAAVQAAWGAEAVGLSAMPWHARAFVLAQSGVAHAAAGSRREALTAMNAAENALERAAPPDSDSEVTGPFDSYPRAALLYQQGKALHALGDAQGALRAWHTSLDLCPDSDCRGRTLTHCEVADVLLAAGRLEESCAAIDAAVDLAVMLHSEQTRHALKRLVRALRPYTRSPGVRRLTRKVRQMPEVLP